MLPIVLPRWGFAIQLVRMPLIDSTLCGVQDVGEEQNQVNRRDNSPHQQQYQKEI